MAVLTYHDKALGRDLVLTESSSEFLVTTKAGDAESLAPLVSQRLFAVERANDTTFTLSLRSETESATETAAALAKLRADPNIASVTPAVIDATGARRFVHDDRVVILVRSGSEAALKALLDKEKAKVVSRGQSGNMLVIRVPKGHTIASLIDKLNQEPTVVVAEPAFIGINDQELDIKIAIRGTGEGEAVGDSPASWNLDRIRAMSAWARTRGNSRVLIGVVDGSPELGHPALAGRVVSLPADPAADSPVSSHATNICGIVAGESPSFSGVAPACRVVPLVVDLYAQLYAERADAILAAVGAVNAGAIDGIAFDRMVLSCSWRTAGDVSVVRLALQEAVRAGILVVCSAGNESSNAPHFPSDYSASGGDFGGGVVSVASTDQDDVPSDFTNYSPRIDLAAPGGNGLPLDERDVYCTEQGNSYGYAAGTSIAAPHVAAVAALALSVSRDLSPAQLKSMLRACVDPVRQSPAEAQQRPIGTGRINAALVVAAAAEAGNGGTAPGGGGTFPEPGPDGDDTSGPGQSSGPVFTIDVGDTGSEAAAATALRRAAEAVRTDTGWTLLSFVIGKGGKISEMAGL